MPYICPVILSGGVGSRLWPLSRRQLPKQLLNLVGDHSLIQETALRTMGPAFTEPLIICHVEHRFLVAEQMHNIGVEPEQIVLEPIGRNTAPAAAVAALVMAERDPEAVLLLMPADHAIQDRYALQHAILVAAHLAEHGHLVTFGVRPRGPDTGYGYVQRGTALSNGEAFAVTRFVEKPDVKTANRYVESGDYYWNSGIFAFQARTYLAELERLEPDILVHCRQAIGNGKNDGNCLALATEPFAACKSISIDYAVMERTDKAAIVPVEMGWSDIGSWAALWETSPKQSDGNVLTGDILHHKTRNSYLRSDGPLIATVGVADLIVIADQDAVLVGSRSAAQDVKKVVEQLEQTGSDLLINRRKINHSWGWSECIKRDENFQVNRIQLNLGAAASFPARHVSHWIVTAGTAKVTRHDKTFLLEETESSVFSAANCQLENIGTVPLSLIEVRIEPFSDKPATRA